MASVSAESFGAVGDNAANNATAIQAAIDAVAASGGGLVTFGDGYFCSGPLTLKSRVKLKGASKNSTELKLICNSNATFIKSQGFDGLTGQNKWNESDGVACFVGFSDIRINGNKALQTAGDGVQLYAKGIDISDAIVFDCFGRGIYSECGIDGGVSAWPTYPEGAIDGLTISGCGSHGWHNRGPHDLNVRSLTLLINGGDGMRVESSASYMSSADFGFLHSYANTGRGLNLIGSEIRAASLRLEDNYGEGLYASGSTNIQIAALHLFNNCRSTGAFQGVLDATSHRAVVASLVARQPGRAAAGGLLVRSHFNRISGTIAGLGAASTGTAFDVDACGFNNVDLIIADYAGAGGVGLRTQETSQLFWTQIRAVVSNCATLWRNGVVGANNHFDINGSANAGQTQFSGVGPNTGSLREVFKVDLWKSGSATVQYGTA